MENFKYNLAIVTIMKYEEPYVEEWVKYHLEVGVKHFYIYDNNEESYMGDVLKQYIDDGIVDLIPMYGPTKMFEAYNQALVKYKDDCKYLAYIDADEFLTPIEDVKVDTLIEDIISKYDDGHVGGLAANWQVYGTGNHKTKPDGLMMENYLYVENKPDADRHVKIIVNPRVVKSFNNPHMCHYKPGYHTIDENGNMVNGPFNPDRPRNLIRLNHYFYKSEEEFMVNRVRRGKCDRPITQEEMKQIIESFYDDMVNSNREYDDLMLRYVDRIR